MPRQCLSKKSIIALQSVGREGVAVVGEVHAQAIRRVEQGIGRPGAEHRLPHDVRE